MNEHVDMEKVSLLKRKKGKGENLPPADERHSAKPLLWLLTLQLCMGCIIYAFACFPLQKSTPYDKNFIRNQQQLNHTLDSVTFLLLISKF